MPEAEDALDWGLLGTVRVWSTQNWMANASGFSFGAGKAELLLREEMDRGAGCWHGVRVVTELQMGGFSDEDHGEFASGRLPCGAELWRYSREVHPGRLSLGSIGDEGEQKLSVYKSSSQGASLSACLCSCKCEYNKVKVTFSREATPANARFLGM